VLTTYDANMNCELLFLLLLISKLLILILLFNTVTERITLETEIQMKKNASFVVVILNCVDCTHVYCS